MRHILTAACIAFALTGCYNDKLDQLYPNPGVVVCDTTNVTFATTIQPILNANCNNSGCHDAGTASSGYDLTTHAGAMLAANNDRLLGCINWSSGFSMMPKNLPKLQQCDIDKITSWVNHGAPNN